MRFIILIGLIFFCCTNVVFPQQKRLYIANDDHTDYMWTANEARYDSAFVQMLDYYLQQIDSTRNHPSDFQARFNCDGSLWLKAYQKYRSPLQFEKLIAAIKSGHISSPLNMLVNCYGAQPTEAVIRGMYFAGQIERAYKLRFTMAGAMENNTLPLGLAALWAGSGAKYSWKGIGGYGSQLSYEIREKRPHQMYRYNGLDGSGLLMKWYNFNEKTTPPLGGYAECRLNIKYKNLDDDFNNVINTLDKYCDTISLKSTYPYNIAGAFGFGHDDLETYISPAYINAAKNGTNANRKVRVSNQEDFFKDFEKTYKVLPSQSVSFGNEWDLLPASMNATTAAMKRATEKLRSAEAMAAIICLNEPLYMNGLLEMRNQAWESFGVYWEHNWTADGPVSRKARADWQIKKQQNLSNYVDTLYNLSIQKLGSQIKQSILPTFFVFNPLSWVRNDVADLLYDGDFPVNITEKATGKEVSSQLIMKHGKQYIRVWAENIPSVGYKVYEIRKGIGKFFQPSVLVDGEYISNKFYRVRLSPSGAITELYDSLVGSKQLVKQTDGRFANDIGANDIHNGRNIVVENAGPVSVTLKAVAMSPVLHTVRITLYGNSKRIVIEDSIQQNFGDVKTWAFSFNLKNTVTRHEELGAVLTVKKQERGGHYANSIARYDWQTFNHFANISEGNYGITLSNQDASFFKLGSSTIDSLWETSSQLHALAGGNIDKKVEDGGVLGIFNQNGLQDFSYNFAITTHQSKFDAIAAMQFSLEHQNPLVTGVINGSQHILPANQYSFLKIDNRAVLLWSVKPAEDGTEKGIVTRFWNFSPNRIKAKVLFNRPVSSAWKTSHIETDESAIQELNGTLPVYLNKHQIQTYRSILLKK